MVDELGDDFRVGFALEFVAAQFKENLDILVVCDDSVMNDDERVFDIRSMWMRVEFARNTVSCPTCMRNAAVRNHWCVNVMTEHLLSNGIFKDLHLAGLLDQNDTLSIDGVNGNTGGIIAAIFQSLQSSDEILENFATSFRRQIV